MISLAFTRSSYTAALCVIALTCGPPTAAAQQGPPPPDEAARNLQQRCPQLGDTGQSLAALAELLRRTQSGGNYLPVQVAAAAAELRTYASLARRPDVRGIELVPSRAGGRTPDAVIRVRGPGGLLRDMRIEVKTVTGRGPGIQRRAGGGRPVPSRPAETADIKRALRSGFQNTPQRPSQLVAPLRVGGRTIPPGGRLVIHLPRDTRSPTAVADAMRDMASGLRGAPHVQEIEFFRFDRVARRWTIERYVRDPDGSYRTDEPPDGGDPTDGCDGPRPGPTGPGPKPVDATRRAIGDAAAQAPEARAPIPSAAPVLAPRGPGMATTGLPLDDTLGGVDFSSLELRYVSDVSTTRTRAAGFAFTALPGGGDGDGRRTAQRASDAFFVWLALPPRTFTVNLDPGDPDRIVDKQFGRTNPGRVLLEADLRMKKTVAHLIHPDSGVGRRYWSEVHRFSGKQSCFSFRQWIVPAQATVHESDGELYILKAPLSVKLERDYLRAHGVRRALGDCKGSDRREQARIEAVYRRLVLPRVQRAVRRAPEYAALRRVYFSRVAAEWYRERRARNGGAFAGLVDSGDISPWAQTRSWTPRDVFDRYLRSYREGEFNVKRRSREGDRIIERTYVYGGVDFRHVPRRNVSNVELQTMRPGMSQRISRALSQPATDPQSGEVWLAGASFDRASAATDPAFQRPAVGGSWIGAPAVAALVALLLALLAAAAWRWLCRTRDRLDHARM